jgi:hypothetical protein
VAVEFQPGGSPEFRILDSAEGAQWLNRVKTAQEWIGPGRNQVLYMLTAAGGPQPDAGAYIKITRQTVCGSIPLPNATENTEKELSTVEISVEKTSSCSLRLWNQPPTARPTVKNCGCRVSTTWSPSKRRNFGRENFGVRPTIHGFIMYGSVLPHH